VLLVVVTHFTVFAPSAFSVALLAEVLGVVGVHFLRVLVHLVDLVKSKVGCLFMGEGSSETSLGVVGLEVVNVSVLFLQLGFKLLNLHGSRFFDILGFVGESLSPRFHLDALMKLLVFLVFLPSNH